MPDITTPIDADHLLRKPVVENELAEVTKNAVTANVRSE